MCGGGFPRAPTSTSLIPWWWPIRWRWSAWRRLCPVSSDSLTSVPPRSRLTWKTPWSFGSTRQEPKHWRRMFGICSFSLLCWRTVSVPLQVNIKMRAITEKELKMKQHLLESSSQQKVTPRVSLCFTSWSHALSVCLFVSLSLYRSLYFEKSFLFVECCLSFLFFVYCPSGCECIKQAFLYSLGTLAQMCSFSDRNPYISWINNNNNKLWSDEHILSPFDDNFQQGLQLRQN